MTATESLMQNSERTVFITNYKGQDLSHAQTFGKIKAIRNDKYIETFQMDVLSAQVAEALANSHPEDWLIPTGHMVLGILAALEFLHRHRRLNLLVWHAKQRKYVPRILQLNPDRLAKLVDGMAGTDPLLTEILFNEVPVETV